MKTFLKKLANESVLIYNKNKDKFFISLLLQFLSIFYSIAYKIRLFLYDIGIFPSHRLKATVVSIGNISTGGTGKTPMAIECAKYFLSLGKKTAIVLRGYKGTFESSSGVLMVSDGVDILTDYEQAGEEAVLIAKNVPSAAILVGKNRLAACKAAISLGAEIIILDDGYQHLKIKRDHNLLLIDSYFSIGLEKVLPAGSLRESINSVNRATKIIFTNSDKKELLGSDLSSIKSKNNCRIFKTGSRLSSLISLNTKKRLDIAAAKKMKALIFCGIGNPQSFADSLKRSEILVVSQIFFPDHNDYEYATIKDIVYLAKKYGVEDIITTEKDAIKIEELCQAEPINFWYAKHELSWTEDNFMEKLFSGQYE